MKRRTSEIGTLLKQARETKGLTQRALSQLAGLPQAHISKIENGTVDLRVSSLVELARVLDLELTLVPRKALPAVHSIIRSRKDAKATGRDASARIALNELKQLQKQIADLIQIHPANTDLAQLQRQVRDLLRLEIPQQYVDTLREISHSIKETRQAGAAAPSLRHVRRALQDLRTSVASNRFPQVEKVHPAYSLDEEDEDGE
jgi:transcriptional regulator with XRE-family HTH domain